MNASEILSSLRSAAKEGTARIYRRHGSAGEVLGVLYSDLAKLQKRIRCDHALALELWRTGIHEARVLATQVADPALATRKEIDRWLKDCEGYPMVDAFSAFVARTPHADSCLQVWMEAEGEWPSSAAWALLSRRAQDGAESNANTDEFFEAFLRRIERGIAGAPNRTRHAMNGALIGIGLRNERLRDLALATARRIGKVEVDHGETDCKTPDAAAYILKTLAYRAKKKG